MTARDRKQFRNFSVQVQTENGWENDLLWVSYEDALLRCAVYMVSTRIIGHHRSGRGGVRNRLVLETRR